jgi:hypothetical protein
LGGLKKQALMLIGFNCPVKMMLTFTQEKEKDLFGLLMNNE